MKKINYGACYMKYVYFQNYSQAHRKACDERKEGTRVLKEDILCVLPKLGQ